MLRFTLLKLLRAIPLLWGISTLVFLLVHLLPGDPLQLLVGEHASQEQRASIARALRLDLPLFWNGDPPRAPDPQPMSSTQPQVPSPVPLPAQWQARTNHLTETQYGWFIHDLLTGELTSLHARRPVFSIMREKLPYTLLLGTSAMSLALLLGLPLGTLAARRPGGVLDRTALLLSMTAVSLPSFWLGPVGMLIFGVWLGWLPISGTGSIWHLILPTLTLGLGLTGVLLRMTRAVVLETLQEDFIRTARGKGLSELRVLFAHALRASLGPVVVVIGLQLGAVLTGSILTEEIFGWPGLGRELILAIRTRDYPLLQGCVLLISSTWVLINLVSELVQAAVHPRVRALLEEAQS